MFSHRLSTALTSRRGAWISLAIALAVMTLLMGVFARAVPPAGSAALPAQAESARVTQLLETFPSASERHVLLVAEASGPLSVAQRSGLDATVAALAAQAGHPASPVRVSEDGRAALADLRIDATETSDANAQLVKALRETAATHAPDGVTTYVTGGPAFAADVTLAFAGADFTLLIVTIAVVAVLLIATYRSPILWLLPIAVVGLADGVAGKVTAALGTALDLHFDSGIISVLVFGAGANYALLLISRYREYLRREADHRVALAGAWRATAPALLASNVTVVLAVATLALAAVPTTRGLGLTAATGLLIALLAVLFALPPLLAVCGRRVFWPYAPRVESAEAPDAVGSRGWGALAAQALRRPALSLAAGGLVLLVLASGLLGARVGLSQTEQFRGEAGAAQGVAALSRHFDAGAAQPLEVVAASAAAESVQSALGKVAGVSAMRVVETNGTFTRLQAVTTAEPGSAESRDLVERVRDTAHSVPSAGALVGGEAAAEADARAAHLTDFTLVAPLVVLAGFVVLVAFLRTLVAPLLLLLINIVSAGAALGLGAVLSRVVLGESALDLQVPLLAWMFLVALGVDYTIFVVHRARQESLRHGTREGMVRAIGHTGGVITSAGLVLAGVFAALGVLPLVTLGQLGLIVGVGVLVDTLLVRSVVVPALFGLVGDKLWGAGFAREADAARTNDPAAAPTLTGPDALTGPGALTGPDDNPTPSLPDRPAKVST
ncbi:MMPL family transporter [Micrococcales bacterium 31B]|nr:MMPL family transporter [Micrococcales bacterium 31B]